MGNRIEHYFDYEECPFCKGKKFKAVVTSKTFFYKDEGRFWEDEMAYGDEDVQVFCSKCNKEIEDE